MMAIKGKEWWQELVALEGKNVIPTPEDEAKMSEVILELADPLIDGDISNAKQVDFIIQLTIVAGNKGMFLADRQGALENRSLIP